VLALWKSQGSPLRGHILAGETGRPVILDNSSERDLRPTLSTEHTSILPITRDPRHSGFSRRIYNPRERAGRTYVKTAGPGPRAPFFSPVPRMGQKHPIVTLMAFRFGIDLLKAKE
jgi:hypothetical protein